MPSWDRLAPDAPGLGFSQAFPTCARPPPPTAWPPIGPACLAWGPPTVCKAPACPSQHTPWWRVGVAVGTGLKMKGRAPVMASCPLPALQEMLHFPSPHRPAGWFAAGGRARGPEADGGALRGARGSPAGLWAGRVLQGTPAGGQTPPSQPAPHEAPGLLLQGSGGQGWVGPSALESGVWGSR